MTDIFISEEIFVQSHMERINSGVGVCAYNPSHEDTGIRETAGQLF